MTVLASGGDARTLAFRAGDVGYVPFAQRCPVEDTRTGTWHFLEACRPDRPDHHADVSPSRWLAPTPPEPV